ncbi:hypothetical protein ACROYT_G016388 [Oculina patagonica]
MKHCIRPSLARETKEDDDVYNMKWKPDMAEIHRIILLTPYESDDAWESSSESEDDSASEDAETEENNDEPVPSTSAARGNRGRSVCGRRATQNNRGRNHSNGQLFFSSEMYS